jgi:hypothetical protein
VPFPCEALRGEASSSRQLKTGLGEAAVTGGALPLSDGQARGPQVPKNRFGNHPGNESEGSQNEPDTAIQRNTILPGHREPSERDRSSITLVPPNQLLVPV